MTPFVIEEKEPCLVPARQGFSVLYKDRWLYSRYEPEKAITTHIAGLSIQSETLILAISPCAGYGLQQLIDALPPSCHIVTLEQDPYLFAFYARTCPRAARNHQSVSNLFIKSPEELPGYLLSGFATPALSHFRRILTINMSAGADLAAQFYQQAADLAAETLFTFWKNHLTLNRLGKLYNANWLRNIPSITGPDAIPFPAGSVTKTLLVVGAGPSAEQTLAWLSAHQDTRNKLYILAVDAAVTAMKSHGLAPDGVVAVESQFAVEKAYIGWKTSGEKQPHLFADCSSRPAVIHGFGNISFFATTFCNTTLFADCSWVRRYRNLCTAAGIPLFKPQGSVGNTAVEVSLLLRGPDTPVFITGLDFSFTPGATHTKHTAQYEAVMNGSNRLRSPANYGAAFSTSARKRPGKGNRVQITDPNLEGYAALFASRHRNTELLFDLGSTGLPLALPQATEEHLAQFAEACFNRASDRYTGPETNVTPQTGIDFLSAEKDRLQVILDTLSPEAIRDCAYVYLHFPDSMNGIRTDTDFLKRIKAEATWFYKQVTTALQELMLQER
ncbi:MAG: DUF115 domain-containing protein [Treponemataceae bacterium]|nr:DUF115 domain-containing protein [Treponemataceae bacterium]